MSDLGQLSYFLGIEFEKTREGILMHQTRYAPGLLEKFKMSQSNSARTPWEVGLKLEKNSTNKCIDLTARVDLKVKRVKYLLQASKIRRPPKTIFLLEIFLY